MRNVRALLSYDGSAFFGWQRQEGFLTVQQALEEAIEGSIGDSVVVFGSGRTDTGVHALAQVASFHLETRLTDEKLLKAVNAHLPAEVVVRSMETCPEGFHALKSARGKRYGYRISTARFRPPFARQYQHWVPKPLDLEAMRRAAAHLVGEHDFSALANAGSPRKTNVRRIHALHLLKRREAVHLYVQGSGFLYNMVRTIAGTLIEVGHGKRVPGSLPELLASRDRTLAGPTAPAEGLYLLRVLYPTPCFPPRGAGNADRTSETGVFEPKELPGKGKRTGTGLAP